MNLNAGYSLCTDTKRLEGHNSIIALVVELVVRLYKQLVFRAGLFGAIVKKQGASNPKGGLIWACVNTISNHTRMQDKTKHLAEIAKKGWRQLTSFRPEGQLHIVRT